MHGKFLAGLLLILPCALALGEPLVRVHSSYYYVEGASATVLSTQIEARGPAMEDGTRRPGKTSWDVQWKLNHLREGDTCGIQHVAVAVVVAQTLPKWGNEDAGAAALKARWKKFSDAVRQHEDKHLEFARQAGVEVEAALLAMKPASNCEDLDRAANAAAEQLIEKYRKDDAAYERATDHGRKQGATLP